MEDKFAQKALDWDNPEKMKMTDQFAEAMFRNIVPQSNWKALEIGAGTGLVGLQVLPKVKSVVFEDTSEAMLGILKQKLNGSENVEIVHGEVFDYQNKDIDLVFSCMAFHHLPDIDKALNHLYEITNEKATIVVGDIRFEDGSFHRFEPIPHTGFDTNQLSEQFNKAGFEVKSAETYNILKRERVPGIMAEYEQFILVAEKK
ncbi:MAG: class I SAM-dependent methyltransferase [Paludibacter sp.]|jgi:ubiquinone/menaquinone biosynthesis C-methylase UbiE|uniref:class I SAM-dependent DNA methyltransferase n=1 Tax=Flavobacterium sp. UBA6031 TaxID=1946551 RepID=UPI0025BC5237|nr:class I SAM-dependent methyltransferase [Flavobacterium sp. UBA6031]MDD5185247.1 class I SAM-dependent methyltransferase [Paludibacter sp.]